MRKKQRIFLAGLILICAIAICLSACTQTFDGYMYSLDSAREQEANYREYDFLFTAEQENVVVDFLITGNELRIVKIVSRESILSNKKQFRIVATSVFNIDESIYESESNNKYYWISSGNKPIQVEWLVVSKHFNDSHENISGCEFTYMGEDFYLCYKIRK